MVAQITSSEADLRRRWQANEPAAWREIIRLYSPMLQRAIHPIVRCQSDTEEIMNDALLSAHRAIAGFRGDSSLATWLHKIARRKALNRYHYWRRRRRDRQVADECPEVIRLADSGLDPRRAALLAELTAAVDEALPTLSPRQRELIELRRQDVDYRTIAAQCGSNFGTVKSRIARAREALRARLKHLST